MKKFWISSDTPASTLKLCHTLTGPWSNDIDWCFLKDESKYIHILMKIEDGIEAERLCNSSEPLLLE